MTSEDVAFFQISCFFVFFVFFLRRLFGFVGASGAPEKSAKFNFSTKLRGI